MLFPPMKGNGQAGVVGANVNSFAKVELLNSNIVQKTALVTGNHVAWIYGKNLPDMHRMGHPPLYK
jgi:hypothetical protein